MPSLWMMKAKTNVLIQQKKARIQNRFRRDSWEGTKGFELSPRRERFEEEEEEGRGMRWLPLLPAVFALVALILAFCCLLAGSRPGYMDDYALLTLDTSFIGLDLVKPPTNNTSSPEATPLSALVNPLLSTSQSIFNKLTTFFAKRAGIQDLYSIHMTNYCYGTYNQNLTSTSPAKQTTGCSTRTVLFAFDPLPILQHAFDKANITLSVQELNWPKALQDNIAYLKTIAHIAVAGYSIAIAFSFFTIFTCAYRVSPYSAGSRRVVALAFGFAGVACAGLWGASVMVTLLMDKGKGLVDRYGAPVGITVVRGNGFLGLTWGATLVAFAGVVAVGGECCRRRNREAIKVFFEK
ncbi:hypothetical protein EG327_003013 [Venturia inaequalis]|uniref:Integral membrane protein n=1 Tax=Venturia inaequalis TaxID=5025 RepID=A0A8H3ZD61_VENIN|nr:hypothetical protein EG327_003013 [Venturia inaequalis]